METYCKSASVPIRSVYFTFDHCASDQGIKGGCGGRTTGPLPSVGDAFLLSFGRIDTNKANTPVGHDQRVTIDDLRDPRPPLSGARRRPNTHTSEILVQYICKSRSADSIDRNQRFNGWPWPSLNNDASTVTGDVGYFYEAIDIIDVQVYACRRSDLRRQHSRGKGVYSYIH